MNHDVSLVNVFGQIHVHVMLATLEGAVEKVCNDTVITYHNVTLVGYFWFHLDINECESSPCLHACNNTDGSFVCTCYDGYILLDDGCSCGG